MFLSNREYDVVSAGDRAVIHTGPYLHMGYHLEEIHPGGYRCYLGDLGREGRSIAEWLGTRVLESGLDLCPSFSIY